MIQKTIETSPAVEISRAGLSEEVINQIDSVTMVLTNFDLPYRVNLADEPPEIFIRVGPRGEKLISYWSPDSSEDQNQQGKKQRITKRVYFLRNPSPAEFLSGIKEVLNESWEIGVLPDESIYNAYTLQLERLKSLDNFKYIEMCMTP